MTRDESELLRRKIERERAARREAENLLEAKSRELYRHNQVLQSEIAERKRVERDLADKAEALIRSNSELQQFAYVASHDLQAPLRNIVGFSQLLLDKHADALGESGVEFLGFIRQGALSMHALINDLLDLSRVDTRGEEMAPLALSGLLERLCQDMRADIQASGACVQWDDLPMVFADASQMRQVFQNLIGNAIKFQPAGRVPQVGIKAVAEDECWHIEVCDNGIGIEDDQLERVFVIFRRLHTAEEYPGTGIGLAICRKIVERHGGRIWIDSQAGHGCQFHFTLPFEAGKPAQAASQSDILAAHCRVGGE